MIVLVITYMPYLSKAKRPKFYSETSTRVTSVRFGASNTSTRVTLLSLVLVELQLE